MHSWFMCIGTDRYVERELFFQMENKIKDILSGFLTRPLAEVMAQEKEFPRFSSMDHTIPLVRSACSFKN